MVKNLAEVLDDRYLVIHAANCEREFQTQVIVYDPN